MCQQSMELRTRFDYLFSVLELQCLIEFNTVIKSCHLINEICSVAVYPMLYSVFEKLINFFELICL